MSNYANEWAKREMQRLREERGNKCGICGEPLAVSENGVINLQFAHLRPTGLKGGSRGRKERILDIRKHPDAYRLLCIDCHLEHDHLYQQNTLEGETA